MAHRTEAMNHCKNYLQSLELLKYFSVTLFNNFYYKHGTGNAYHVGLSAADYILFNSQP